MEEKKKKAVFLDRDGVMVEDVHHLHRIADLSVIPQVPEAIVEMRKRGYLVIVVTNQAAVAKGIATIGEVEAINNEMLRRLALHGATIDGVYYCPHHPKGKVAEYAVVCECRKPSPGMLLQAARELDIDLAASFLVGDKTSDILAGERAKVKTILVETGYGGTDGANKVVPNIFAKDLWHASQLV